MGIKPSPWRVNKPNFSPKDGAGPEKWFFKNIIIILFTHVTHVSHIASQLIAQHSVDWVVYFLHNVEEHEFLCMCSKFQSFTPTHCVAVIFIRGEVRKYYNSVHIFSQDSLLFPPFVFLYFVTKFIPSSSLLFWVNFKNGITQERFELLPLYFAWEYI